MRRVCYVHSRRYIAIVAARGCKISEIEELAAFGQAVACTAKLGEPEVA